MPMHISRIGYQAILDAAEVDPSVRRFVELQGHRVVILSDPEEEVLLERERRFVDSLMKAVEESDDTDYSITL
jgi:hypothetical protein